MFVLDSPFELMRGYMGFLMRLMVDVRLIP